MDATITGETDEVLGVSVVDNADVEHVIDVENATGAIVGHGQDGYADEADERSREENEHVRQARRYARYYVHKERGHPTLPPRDVPEWIAVVASVVAHLPIGEIERYVGEYYQQLRSHVEADVKPVIDVPEDDRAGSISYRQHLHLDVDAEAVLGEQLSASLIESLERNDDLDRVAHDVREVLDECVLDPSALGIADVSSVGALYQTHSGEREIAVDDPLPAPEDARLELSPVHPDWEEYLPMDGFQLLLVHHLLCQSRDCYLQMGLEPPEAFRLLGLGKFRQTIRNEHLDLYPPVHYTDATVQGYRLPDVPL